MDTGEAGANFDIASFNSRNLALAATAAIITTIKECNKSHLLNQLINSLPATKIQIRDLEEIQIQIVRIT